MNRKKIIIDVATIYPGKGGAGGGIWSYARNLLLHLDEQCTANPSLEFICLVNKEFSLSLQQLKVVVVPLNLQNFLFRFFYVHFYLPLFVLLKNAVLHKVYFEVPFYCPAPMLVTIHDCMGDFYKSRNYGVHKGATNIKDIYFRWINKVAIRKSKMICCPSGAVKSELLRQYNIASEKVHVTPLATTGIRSVCKNESLNRRPISLYCIAAFHQHKGQLRLIRIFEHLCNNYAVDAHLFFRGHVNDVAYFQEVQQMIAGSGIKERLHIIPYDVQSTLESIYSDADWMILLSEYEGFGLPIIEAQASGTPVICSDIAVFREVAGTSAFFIKNNWSEETAAAAVANVVQQAHYGQELTEHGFKNTERYSWQKFTVQMLEVYAKMANKAPLVQNQKNSIEQAYT